MTKRSKRYTAASERIDRSQVYAPTDALTLLKDLPGAKFDESVDVVVRLGIDPRKSDQLVRGAVTLPKGLGKEVTVVVFAEGDKADAATAAGADIVGSGDLADKIAGGWMDFDIVIASPDMMRYVGKLGRVLGPQGKMPSPKSGTVTPDVGKAVTEFKAGKVKFNTDAGGNVHAALGKCSFPVADLEANLHAFLEHLGGMRPAAVKGTFLRRISLSTTMGPGATISYEG
ncbi:MAG: large subunit ribosomal protein L1 [Planctomycetota bacterium]|jgi:large subunit ribosomal protein L1